LTVIYKTRSGCYARNLSVLWSVDPWAGLFARLPVVDLKVRVAGLFCVVLGIKLKEKELVALLAIVHL
jgi:hypothetical protein